MTPVSGPLRRVGEAVGDRAQWDHPFGALTTYRVGGTAALFVVAGTEEELLEVARAVSGSPVPVVVLGKGSNMLVADRGFDGLVVALGSGFDDLVISGTEVVAGAAVSLPVLARRTAAAGLHGLEWAVGVPGSVGGAVRMNAGGHGSDTMATLATCRVVDLTSATVTDLPAGELAAGYRHTALAATDVVVSAAHRLVRGDPDDGARAISEIVRWRRGHQPGGSNAGSVFTNPPGDSAGRLIEAAGLKGHRIGTAEVSTKHANFIQADEGGSADDVLALMTHVRAEVFRASGVRLDTEVRMIGFDAVGGPGR
ncbi:MAG: UDP-N-acetylmuramate dehydrogenase [Acidimicrobiales bacterium]